MPCLLGFVVGSFGFFVSAYWNRPRNFSFACLYFGMMNLVAFLTHCVFQPHSPNWDITYTLDMVFTSTSSLHLILWCFPEVKGSFVGATCIYPVLTFLLLYYVEVLPARRLWIAEALYIGVTALAAACVASKHAVPKMILGENRAALGLALTGVGMFLLAPVADQFLCDFVGNPYGNLLTPAFVGCDLAFLGLIWYVISGGQAEPKRKVR